MTFARAAAAAATGLLLVVTAAPAADAAGPTKKQVEVALAKRGFPVGSADGRYDQRTRRALCAWRELTGRAVSRNLPTAAEAAVVVQGSVTKVPGYLRDGIDVNIRCQVAYHVAAGKVKRIMPVSTGMSGHRTRTGAFHVYRSHNKWHRSTIYGAPMYRPLYFSRGMALHGSASDRLVKTYPASHGCVRMRHKDIDYLWKQGAAAKKMPVLVYGKWRG
jgi:lipoprotein-anchoring transpeptidase ErfK/SrfK